MIKSKVVRKEKKRKEKKLGIMVEPKKGLLQRLVKTVHVANANLLWVQLKLVI